VLCVLGEIGSGKTEATRVLKETCGYLEVNSGQVMARLLGIPPVPETPRGIFQAAAWEFISRPSGPQELARALWDEVETHTFPRLLIDGIRQRATLEALRQLARMRKIGVLFVHTPPDVAFEFYKSRAGDEATIHDFLREREQPVESEVRGLISMSDAVLYNWTGRASYVSTITKLMQEVERAGR
jgi:dephospho-CoA kinase